jgi:hypothetical protein
MISSLLVNVVIKMDIQVISPSPSIKTKSPPPSSQTLETATPLPSHRSLSLSLSDHVKFEFTLSMVYLKEGTNFSHFWSFFTGLENYPLTFVCYIC